MVNGSKVLLIQFSDFGLGRGGYLAEAIRRAGFHVTILTNEPIYQRNNYSNIEGSLNPEIRIIEIPFPRFFLKLYYSIVGRLLIYLYFSALTLSFLVLSTMKFEIIYSRNIHPFTDVVSILLKKIGKARRIIADVTDLWPESLELITMNKALRSFFIKVGIAINFWVYCRISKIVTLNEYMAEHLRRYTKKKIDVIYGAIDTEKFSPQDKREALNYIPKSIFDKLINRFIVMYCGLMGSIQDPQKIIHAAELLQDYRDISFVFVGTGPLEDNLRQIVQRKKLDNVTFLGVFPHKYIHKVLSLADLYMMSHIGTAFLRILLPKKFIEYSSMGKPLIHIGPPCVATNLGSKFCITVKAGDSKGLTDAILFVYNNPPIAKKMGREARKIAEELFSLDTVTNKIKVIMNT